MTNRKKSNNNEMIIIDEKSIKDKIYTIRGMQVMLDFDLACIYGYSTKAFNQQVQRNIDKFDEDFRFQLTREESLYIRSQIVTGSHRNERHNIYAFSEQGIYMLMTVLKGELAIRQSKALIRMFKNMKDYLINTNQLVLDSNLLELSIQTNKNTLDINSINNELTNLKNNTIMRKDLSLLIDFYNESTLNQEILLLNGDYFKADIAFNTIYNKAVYSIIIIDDYISIRTLNYLRNINKNIFVTIISNNKSNLSRDEFADFTMQYPNVNIKFIKSNNIVHDRYIIIDYDTEKMKVYHLGASIKDSGKKISMINNILDHQPYIPLINSLLKNKILKLD